MEEALLAINDPNRPWRVRTALAEEDADVVAEWHMMEPAWGKGRDRRQTERTFKFRLRLDGKSHEARVCAEVREITRAGQPPGRIVARRTGKGPRTRVFSRSSDFDFDSNYMRTPLQKVVLTAGWTWRGTRNP
ncbi:hypothetical protein [Streptomyces sp. NPDC046939]|uniref:hypothetical protein n=1 Tax=Streptomyces sp. NPDC046939 TaxID=3155376 RepID=UPI0033E4F0E9